MSLRRALAAAAVALVVLTSGCTSETATPEPTITTPEAGALRGTKIPVLSCRVPGVRRDGPATPVSGVPETMVLCGITPTARAEGVVQLTPADGGLFTDLAAAFSLPDKPAGQSVTAQPCPDSIMILPPILVQTSQGDWALHRPTQTCAQPRSEGVAAIEAVTSIYGSGIDQ